MTAFLLACNILMVFAIKHSDIPVRKLDLDETIQVDVAVAGFHGHTQMVGSTNYPACKLKPEQNYRPDLDLYATYFIKKRLTAQPKATPKARAKGNRVPKGKRYIPTPKPLKRFQFIATRRPIDETDPINVVNAHSNEFPTQLGWIFCENSKVDKLRMRHDNANECGVEQYLVGLCFLDDDVNQINSNSYQLDLDQVFSHYGKGAINDISNVRAQVEGHCNNVIEVHMERQRTGPRAHHNAKRLWKIIKGARYGKYGMLIWYKHPDNGGPGCDTMWKWTSSFDILTKGDEEFFQFYQISNRYSLWYFCDVGDIVKEAMVVGEVPHGFEYTV